VHCIGENNGDIWEQLILLVDVPYVALSATLGNVDNFAARLLKVTLLYYSLAHVEFRQLRPHV
jgi:superfamily II RNA helicase